VLLFFLGKSFTAAPQQDSRLSHGDNEKPTQGA
jgi:hypothetical protein